MKTASKLLIALIAVVIVIFAVFYISGGFTSDTPDPTESAQSPATDDITTPPVTSPAPNGSDPTATTAPTPTPTPEIVLPYTHNGTLTDYSGTYSVTFEERYFPCTTETNTDTFTDPDDDSSLTFIQFRFVANVDSETLSYSFLADYLTYKNISFNGQTEFAEGITAEHISAGNDEQSFEAYLVDVNGGVFAAVIAYPASANDTAADLHAILETLVIY